MGRQRNPTAGKKEKILDVTPSAPLLSNNPTPYARADGDVTPVAIGIGAGVLACVALAGLVQSQLYGVSALNPVLLVSTSTVLIGIGIVACW